MLHTNLPKQWTAEKWRLYIQDHKEDPERQHSYLLIDREQIGLSPEDYLTHLEDLEGSVKYHPALNTYWQKGGGAEETLRQERGG